LKNQKCLKRKNYGFQGNRQLIKDLQRSFNSVI
jgi:hypothetical protein